jgi:hypothetical protein
MIKRAVALTLLAAFFLVMAGCMAHVHKIGNGAQKGEYVEQRQWYVLWGLVPINDVDSHAMASGATNYEVKTELSALDVVLNIFTGFVTIYSRTVTVTQ